MANSLCFCLVDCAQHRLSFHPSLFPCSDVLVPEGLNSCFELHVKDYAYGPGNGMVWARV